MPPPPKITAKGQAKHVVHKSSLVLQSDVKTEPKVHYYPPIIVPPFWGLFFTEIAAILKVAWGQIVLTLEAPGVIFLHF